MISLPQCSHPVDGLSAAHFAQVLEKDRHRFQPVAVAVDHGMLQAGVYLCGVLHHRHGSFPLSISLKSLTDLRIFGEEKIRYALFVRQLLTDLSWGPAFILQHYSIAIWIFERLALLIPIRVERLDRFVPTAL